MYATARYQPGRYHRLRYEGNYFEVIVRLKVGWDMKVFSLSKHDDANEESHKRNNSHRIYS